MGPPRNGWRQCHETRHKMSGKNDPSTKMRLIHIERMHAKRGACWSSSSSSHKRENNGRVSMRGTYVVIIAGLALALAGPGRAGAELSEVRIVAQNGSNYLPLYVMQGHKLVEKHLAAKGLGSTGVVWSKLAGPSAIIDSFLAGAVHFSGQGVPSTALIWDRTRNGIGAKAVSAMVASNIWLMTRKPELKSLRDLTEQDRIALPSIKTSAQALFLWTAAEKQ